MEREDIVVVAANTLRGAARAVDAVAGERGKLLREEALLHLAGDLDFAVDALAARGLAGERVDERADLEREAGLGADGLQQAQVGGRVGLLRALGAETDEAERGDRGRRAGASSSVPRVSSAWRSRSSASRNQPSGFSR